MTEVGPSFSIKLVCIALHVFFVLVLLDIFCK